MGFLPYYYKGIFIYIYIMGFHCISAIEWYSINCLLWFLLLMMFTTYSFLCSSIKFQTVHQYTVQGEQPILAHPVKGSTIHLSHPIHQGSVQSPLTTFPPHPIHHLWPIYSQLLVQWESLVLLSITDQWNWLVYAGQWVGIVSHLHMYIVSHLHMYMCNCACTYCWAVEFFMINIY